MKLGAETIVQRFAKVPLLTDEQIINTPTQVVSPDQLKVGELYRGLFFDINDPGLKELYSPLVLLSPPSRELRTGEFVFEGITLASKEGKGMNMINPSRLSFAIGQSIEDHIWVSPFGVNCKKEYPVYQYGGFRLADFGVVPYANNKWNSRSWLEPVQEDRIDRSTWEFILQTDFLTPGNLEMIGVVRAVLMNSWLRIIAYQRTGYKISLEDRLTGDMLMVARGLDSFGKLVVARRAVERFSNKFDTSEDKQFFQDIIQTLDKEMIKGK